MKVINIILFINIFLVNVLGDTGTFEKIGSAIGTGVSALYTSKLGPVKNSIGGSLGGEFGGRIGKKIDDIDFTKHHNDIHKFVTDNYKKDFEIISGKKYDDIKNMKKHELHNSIYRMNRFNGF
jgi:phage tail tape-measure protein